MILTDSNSYLKFNQMKLILFSLKWFILWFSSIIICTTSIKGMVPSPWFPPWACLDMPDQNESKWWYQFLLHLHVFLAFYIEKTLSHLFIDMDSALLTYNSTFNHQVFLPAKVNMSTNFGDL